VVYARLIGLHKQTNDGVLGHMLTTLPFLWVI
jgi:hypothetical protein